MNPPSDFYRATFDWAYDVYLSQTIWLRRTLIALVLLSFLLTLSLSANLYLLPLKEKVPYLYAFDNGQFTYFKFKEGGMSHLPAIFIVDKNRNETLVNYHMEGQYLIVNGVAKQFTFRDGSYVTSIYNDLAIGDWKK